VLTISPAISINQGLDLADAMRAEFAPLPAAGAVTYQVLRVDRVPASSLLAGLRGVGLHPHQEEVHVEAITPSPRTADLLYRGERGQPTLRVTRRFFDARHRLLATAIGRCAWPAATFSMVRQCTAESRPEPDIPGESGACRQDAGYFGPP
jgi:hypothetical protein